MFELSVASKYLLPRWRQLSVSIISLISILVIALVVWLIVVFFSVVNGLESYWTEKMTALAAPVRVTPTDAYYRSYYYLVDSVSGASDYGAKSIGEKRIALNSDPYDPSFDEEVPKNWSEPDRTADGALKDPVKELFATAESLSIDFPGLSAVDYEQTGAGLRLRLMRGQGRQEYQTYMNQSAFLGSMDVSNPSLLTALLPVRARDIDNVLRMAAMAQDETPEEGAVHVQEVDLQTARKRLQAVMGAIDVSSLETPAGGWSLPRQLIPREATLAGLALVERDKISQVVVPLSKSDLKDLKEALSGAGFNVQRVQVETRAGVPYIDGKALAKSTPLVIPQQTKLPARFVSESLAKAKRRSDLHFVVAFELQGQPIRGTLTLRNLQLGDFSWVEKPQGELPWVTKTDQVVMPSDAAVGEPALLPRQFRDGGVLIGDRGSIVYQTHTASSVQEQRVPFFVAGFYDPGIIPLGGKFALVDKNLTSMIRGSYHHEESDNGNGVHVRFKDFSKAPLVKARLQEELQKRGVGPYWRVETFREFEFAKDILQQQRSDKNLFLVIAGVIIVVACSNIISMLIILVNDKKVEIGILRSMGASAKSIAAIFGVCGCMMGLIGSGVGISAAIYTLNHLDGLIGFMGYVQGHEMFNPIIYGSSLPNELSGEALVFVIGATMVFSLLAGIVPAVKACLLKPSAILRSE